MKWALLIALVFNVGASIAGVRFAPKFIERQKPSFLKHDIVDIRPRMRWLMQEKKIQLTKLVDDKEVYSYPAFHTPEGFRVAEGYVPEKRAEHLILAGCSMIYGEGLTFEETTHYFLEKKLKDISIYNTSVMGGSVFEQLYLFKFFDMREVVLEENGTMIFFIFSDHFERISQTWRYLSWVAPNAPQWGLSSDGVVEYQGTVSDSYKWKVAQKMRKIGLEQYWLRATHHFLRWQMRHKIPLMVEAIKELKQEYLRQFPKGRFIVSKMIGTTWLPDEIQDEEKTFIDLMSKANLEIWDNSPEWEHLIKNSGSHLDYQIPGDGHPNGKRNLINSDFLIKRLNYAKPN